ncbi:MAG: glycosyltransferase family 4 protein [Pseudomonadota bacterium]
MSNFDVIHLVSSLKIGGAERFVIDLSKEQQSEGKTVAILSFSFEDDPLVEIAKKEDITVFFINKKWWNNTLALIKIFGATKVIHCHSLPVMQSICLTLPLLRKKRIIYTRHGERDISTSILKMVHWFAKPFIDVITFVSQGAKDKFISQTQWLNKPAYVVENGVNTALFNRKIQNINSGSVVRFGSVGRMIPIKAQHHLLEAVNQLTDKKKSQCELHFIGDGPCKKYIEKSPVRNKSNIKSYFHGMLMGRNNIFDKFDVLVVNSETEGLSIAIIEAMAFGMPVIATKVGGNPRLVLPNKTGWLYEFNDIISLANIIESILKDKGIIAQFGRNAKEHIKTNFSIEKTAKIYNKLYEE